MIFIMETGSSLVPKMLKLQQLLKKFIFPSISRLLKQIYRSAEMIKYASNAFLATKISFINEIATLCEKVGANIDEVTTGIGRDSRIGPHFLQAGIGYGGSCFPKDTKALSKLAGNVHHPFELLDAVIKVNNHQQALPVMRAKEIIGSLKRKKIALLGLAFKPGTDDIRESASLKIIEQLLEEGALVTAYDPIAISNAQKVFGNVIRYTDNIQEALSGREPFQKLRPGQRNQPALQSRDVGLLDFGTGALGELRLAQAELGAAAPNGGGEIEAELHQRSQRLARSDGTAFDHFQAPAKTSRSRSQFAGTQSFDSVRSPLPVRPGIIGHDLAYQCEILVFRNLAQVFCACLDREHKPGQLTLIVAVANLLYCGRQRVQVLAQLPFDLQ